MALTRTRLDRRRRLAARIALYGALLLVGGLLAATAPLARQWYEVRSRQAWYGVDWGANEAVRQLSDYVRIDTNCETGSEIPGAEYLASLLRAAGIEPHVEILSATHANVWAVLEGEDPQALVLHSHIDTDPLFDDPAWLHPPLSGAISPPWIYGRGVFDMKSVAIAQIRAFIDLHRSGRRLARSVLFLATGSEEVGSDLGTRWFLRARPELTRRFWAVLTEGGAVEARSFEDVKYWGIESAQRGFVEIWACASDRERLERLRAEVAQFDQERMIFRLTPEVEATWAQYAASRDLEAFKATLGDPKGALADFRQLVALPAYLRSALRNEASSFPVREVASDEYEVRLGALLLPGTAPAAGVAEVLPAWLTWGLDLRYAANPVVTAGSPLSHPLFALLAETVQAQHPGVVVGPYFLPYSLTDARFFRAAGIPAFGFSPFLIMSTDTLQVGKTNERMALAAFVDGVELYRKVVFGVALPSTDRR
jgi:aminoacylase